MKPKDIAFAALGIIAAGTFVRLGIWQLERLAERKDFNAQLLARAETPPVDFASLPADTGAAHYRRARVTGTYDFDREIVLTSRSRNGSPGVNIVTPVRVPGKDTAVLVNRGWVYSPDGTTAELARWREPPAVSAVGYVETFRTRPGEVRVSGKRNAYRWADLPTLSQAFPYPIAPQYMVLMGNAVNPPPNVPPRVPVPPLDEGSHLGYAFQWFSFAAISIIGLILYSRRK